MRIPVGSILILAALQLRDRQWSPNMPKGTVERAQNKLYSEILDSFQGKKNSFSDSLGTPHGAQQGWTSNAGRRAQITGAALCGAGALRRVLSGH